ncbi:MAG: carbon monoxide dehydrogenase, FAD-binding subunit [Acidobacteria bacterium]|nr:carbon monoxide dehydrogenase, FAD-binding subunit [Acidobacteriota bacterium]
MMKNFAYVKAGSLAEAIKSLSTQGAWLHAGGIDLLGCARNEILPVEKIVSISRLKQLNGIAAQPDGGVKIGALTSLAQIAANAQITAKYSALAQAAAAVGTPQIREQGTIGGNLCQRPRCWYFRSDLRCLKKGGTNCYAATGENQYHAVFGGGPCFFVHPSDAAVALVALQAQLSIAGKTGSKSVKIESFFVSPKTAVTKENVLLPGEIVTEIRLPAAGGTLKSLFRKIAARGSWDFALASVAVALQIESDGVRAARIVLGGVGPYPWRAEAAEKLLVGRKLDSTVAAASAEAAVTGGMALKGNAYKLDMIKGAVEESLAALI